MSDSADSSKQFSDVGTLDFDDYRPLSVLAVLAGVSSVLALLALAHPLLWVLPLLSLAASVTAFLRLSRPQARESGKMIAAGALLLALLIIGYAPARVLSRHQAMNDQAREFAHQWLQTVLDGKLKTAHQLTLREHEREKGDLDGAYSLTGMEATQEYREARMKAQEKGSKGEEVAAPQQVMGMKDKLIGFRDSPDVARLLEFDRGAKIQFLKNLSQAGDKSSLNIVQQFVVSDGNHKPFEFRVFSERRAYGNTADWRVRVRD